MLWTEILLQVSPCDEKSFSSATAPPSGRSCGVILYIIPKTFPPDWAGLVEKGPADLCLSEDCPEWKCSCVLQHWLICRDGSPSRCDNKDLESIWSLKIFSRVTAVCTALSCLYPEMFSFHEVWWKINTSISEVCWKCSLESYIYVRLSPELNSLS